LPATLPAQLELKGVFMKAQITRALTFALGVLFTTVFAFAQISGDIQVNASDQSSAAVPGATVSIRNLETGAVREGTTDGLGQYRGTQLTVGRYEVKVAHPGFRSRAAGSILSR
jgi:hypothetical protein